MNTFSNHWVWNKVDQTLGSELVDFWLSQNAMREERQARQRVPDVIMIARNTLGELVGITSMESKFLPVLGGEYFFWRQFVRKDLRLSRVSSSMGIDAWNILNQMFREGKIKEKGLVVEIENIGMNSYLKSAVLKPVPFVFIGYTAKGYQRRVCYFDGAIV